MKNKKINFIKLGIFLLGISLFLWSCNEDNLQSEIKQTITNSIEQLSVADALKEISLDSKLSKTFTQKKSLFNQINYNIPANKTYLSNQSISYSFLLKPEYKKRLKNNELYFDNLFVTLDKDNNAYTHILRYIPTKNWLNNSRDLAKYSGKIQYLSNDREILSSIELVEGTVSENYNNKSSLDKRSQRSGGCQLKYVMTVCGALEGNDLSCTHFYELKCGGASYSGGFSDNGGSNYGDTNNEDGFNPGGGSINASPIIAICPPGRIKDSNGNCVLDDKIINQLTGKADCAFNKLLSSGASNFHNMITDLFIEFGNNNIGGRDLTFKMSNNLPSNIGGKTQVDSNGDYHILINENLMNTLSSIEVASILVHEMAHAFLGKHYNDSNASFSELYEKYINDTGIQNYSHDIMKDQFINRMAIAIRNYDNTIFSSFEDYKILASRGVFELSSTQKQNLINVINKARQNDKNCS